MYAVYRLAARIRAAMIFLTIDIKVFLALLHGVPLDKRSSAAE